MNIALPTPRIEHALHTDPAHERAALLQGLLQPAARIDSKYFYDNVGCELFTRICELDEYYPTRTEAAIFRSCAEDIAAALPSGAQWIDLGCGDCAKSRLWLEQIHASRLVGVDIAGEFLQSALTGLAACHPHLECIGVVSDFTQRLDLSQVIDERPDAPPVFFYPGSSIGNFTRPDALRLLRSIRSQCGTRGRLLICVDLLKPRDVLEAAYDDALGVTAEFNLNVLEVVNRELDADFSRERFSHRALFDSQHGRIEMHLVAQCDQDVRLSERNLRHFSEGEHVLTEYSHKYSTTEFGAMLAEAGFGRFEVWTDPKDWFGVFLAEPTA
ncbi:L-histidine N(alpha)-methyltransferase [Pseudomonas sp.]|jgi:dimethylhistidine N-methyltransferase|uniref:L-histidine N(alpha)-methyltransferase n=1 Tax=Pseudomonas sp. TaxID=306 RepID=UPI00272D6A3F|nr:L-histidine N(alpha)-methyltransferase [Pseudomonas sp.]